MRWNACRRAAVLSCPVWFWALAVLGGAPLLTVPATHAAVEDPNGSPPLRRWHRADVVIHLDPSLDALGSQSRLLVERAFAAWTVGQARAPRVHFQRSATPHSSHAPDGRNTVSLASIEFAGHRNDLAVTISYRNSRTGALREVDVIINADKPWASFPTQGTGTEPTPPFAPAPAGSDSAQVRSALLASRPITDAFSSGSNTCNGNFDLLSVMMHEAGHFYGLSENTQSPDATMYHTTAPCETQKRSLESSDLQALSRVYARADVLPSAGRVESGPRRHQGSAAVVLLAWSLVWLLLGRFRRPDGRDTSRAQSGCQNASPSLT